MNVTSFLKSFINVLKVLQTIDLWRDYTNCYKHFSNVSEDAKNLGRNLNSRRAPSLVAKASYIRHRYVSFMFLS